MRRTVVALACAMLLPWAARADPVAMQFAATGGATQSGIITTVGTHLDFGTVWMPTPGSSTAFLVNGLDTWVNYTVTFTVAGMSGWDTLRAEILDPAGDPRDPTTQPTYVPAGWSTSSDSDGFSFAQENAITQAAGMEAIARSAVFAGGSAIVAADENTHRGDILMFSGLSGAESARVTFGLRDSGGSRSFLVHLSAEGGDTLPTPEPASLILMGTGLAGIAAACRRRRRTGSGAGTTT